MKKDQSHPHDGFSLPEVLVSSSILMMVVAGAAQSQLNSFGHTTNAGEQNAVQARITEDLNDLKMKAFRWQCTQETACEGEVEFEHIPMRYNTSTAVMTSACSNQTLGETMLDTEPNLFPPSTILSWGNDAPHEAHKVEITREIKTSVDNANEIQIKYTTKGSSRNLVTKTTIIPQAANWCA